jgi:hypothetical protein
MSNLAPVDPNVRMPAAVVAAAARAHELQQQAYGQPAAPVMQETPPAPVVDPAPVAQAPQAPVQPSQPPPFEPERDWKRDALAAEGRLRRSNEELRALRVELDELRTTVANLRSSAPPPPAPAEPPPSRITDKEREEFGAELLDVVGRRAAEVFEQQASKLIEPVSNDLRYVKQRVDNVAHQTAASAHERYLHALEAGQPNWVEVNEDPRFLAWLDLRDPYSGDTRMKLLEAAHARRDANRVLAFFHGFLAEVAGVPAGGHQIVAPPAPPPAQLSMEALAAPGKAKAAAVAPTTPAEKPVISRADIDGYYAAKRRGQYSAEEAERYERMIFEAQREGRIR